MTNEDPRIAPLRRKMAATQEPAKAAELAVVLRGLGFDPDAVEEISAAPKGRSEPKLQTTESKTETDEKRRPARPAAKPAAAKPATPKTAAKPAATKTPAKGASK
jgi:hypothetical protein